MSEKLRLSDLNPKRPVPFDLRPDASQMEEMRGTLDLLGLRKVRFSGNLQARGKRDWELTARIGATVIQPCGVTLEPVTTRIEEDVRRLYVAEWVDPEDAEVEMPEDDTTEPLPVMLDLVEVAQEALSLALPMFPRADDAAFDGALITEPGAEPMTDEAAKPFAGLAALKQRMEE